MSLTQVTQLKQPMLGDLIRELRGLTNITQEQFAAATGTSGVAVSRWQAGQIQPFKLARRPAHAFTKRLSQSTSQLIHNQENTLLALYADMQG
ncbi:MAG: helix-turn-helix transcriptional regulator [Oculatellaceae cyanobacterium bins.114]|nr:helix-turn-helix transcriptional regulator [Oculatellaceae cyanobacterium bins.114]